MLDMGMIQIQNARVISDQCFSRYRSRRFSIDNSPAVDCELQDIQLRALATWVRLFALFTMETNVAKRAMQISVCSRLGNIIPRLRFVLCIYNPSARMYDIIMRSEAV